MDVSCNCFLPSNPASLSGEGVTLCAQRYGSENVGHYSIKLNQARFMPSPSFWKLDKKPLNKCCLEAKGRVHCAICARNARKTCVLMKSHHHLPIPVLK